MRNRQPPEKRDSSLDELLGDLRARVKRRRHGRLVIVLEVMDGQVVRRWVKESVLTEEDYARLMRERPWPRGPKGERRS
jgi:hypothetical protein